MRVVRRLGAAATTLFVFSGTVLLSAPSAQAAGLGTWYFSGTFFTQDPTSMSGSQPLALSGQVGDTFMLENRDSVPITLTNASGSVQRTIDNQTCTSTTCAITQGNSSSFRILSAGDVSVTGGSGVNPATITITVTGGGGGDSFAFTVGPSPIVQQFGKPVMGTCDAAQPTGLDWAGVASGGWSESWAQWMNGRGGGEVCTRTLTYSSQLARWLVSM